jgi:hypothetical protein
MRLAQLDRFGGRASRVPSSKSGVRSLTFPGQRTRKDDKDGRAAREAMQVVHSPRHGLAG